MTPGQLELVLRDLRSHFKATPSDLDPEIGAFLINVPYVKAARACSELTRQPRLPTIHEVKEALGYGSDTDRGPVDPPSSGSRSVLSRKENAQWARSLRSQLAPGGSSSTVAAPKTAPSKPPPTR